jgi:hypothetical protein
VVVQKRRKKRVNKFRWWEAYDRHHSIRAAASKTKSPLALAPALLETFYVESDYERLKTLAESKFLRLGKLSGVCTLTPLARTVFEEYQRTNRSTKSATDQFDEPLLSRLSSAPVQVLKVAMIFEACRSVKAGSNNLQIEKSTISLAINHVEECLKAINSVALETIAHRIYIKNDAEVLLAKIRVDFWKKAKNGSIILSLRRSPARDRCPFPCVPLTWRQRIF